MLIEFSVKNFRSIKDRQTLSLVASNKEPGHPGNVFDCPGLKSTKLVKSAVLYGANASGKSNILLAAYFMFDHVRDSATGLKPDEGTGVTPFLLDEESKNAPSEFEVHFVHENVRYQYGFLIDADKIHREWLTAYPHGRPQRWFLRELNAEKQDYDWNFGPSFSGDKKALIRVTNGNALFLSVGAQFKHEGLARVQNWFSERTHFLDYAGMDLDITVALATAISKGAKLDSNRLSSLLQQADLGIEQLEFKEKRPADDSSFPDSIRGELAEQLTAQIPFALQHPGVAIPLALPEELTKRLVRSIAPEPLFHHRASDGRNHVAFPKEDESAGTLKFFSLLAFALSSFTGGYTVFVDEIAAYMHPLLVRHLLALIHDPKINTEGTQWIFSTHDVTLLDTSLFRRDQVWFTEKNRQGATTLYPLSDFKPRKDEALQKGYLAGRYGAIPFFAGEFTF